jgi:glycosyltransferase involved in cell wall biosynthesis
VTLSNYPDGPDYSIVVPTYRRRDALARCLQAIEALRFPRERFEVVIVDDGSPNPAADLVASLDRSLQARLVLAPHAGPATARNTGARLARGRYLVFTDDDCMPREDWLSSIDRWTSSKAGPFAIGGHTVNVLTDNLYAAASQSVIDYLYEYFGDHSATRRFFTSNNLVVPREEFLSLDGFNETFALAAAEDRDFCERWIEAGKRLQYANDVVVSHAHVLDFPRFSRQHVNYGRGAFDLHRSRARRGDPALRVEPAPFYLGLITYPLRRSRGTRGVMLALLHFWSQLAYASGYVYERIRRGWAVSSRSAVPPRAARVADMKPDNASADEGSMSGAA